MALDVYLQRGSEPPRVGGQSELVAQLEDGHLSFVRPFFEQLQSETGQIIAPYDDALFCGETLNALESAILSMMVALETKPKIWHEHIGTQTSPARREIYGVVEKSQMRAMLENLLVAIEKAKQTGYSILFFGD